jgi:hypothetical protein
VDGGLVRAAEAAQVALEQAESRIERREHRGRLLRRRKPGLELQFIPRFHESGARASRCAGSER